MSSLPTNLFICCLSLFLLVSVSSPSANASSTQMEEVAEGGPYMANKKHIQQFAGKFKLSQSDAKRPMTLTLHNGFSGNPGFDWLRVFLCGDIDPSGFGNYEEPQGDLVLDENYVQKHTISIDITDLVEPGVNTVYIEGKGAKGSVLSWTVSGSVSPQLSTINPTQTNKGAKLTLSGRGFSHDEDENEVFIAGIRAKVVQSSRTRLTILVPENVNSGLCQLKVIVNGVESATSTIDVKAPSLSKIQ